MELEKVKLPGSSGRIKELFVHDLRVQDKFGGEDIGVNK